MNTFPSKNLSTLRASSQILGIDITSDSELNSSIWLIFPSMSMHFIMLFVDLFQIYAFFYQFSNIWPSMGHLEITSDQLFSQRIHQQAFHPM